MNTQRPPLPPLKLRSKRSARGGWVEQPRPEKVALA
jgi:hypothetical protein